MKDFDPSNIAIVDIGEVRLNEWNPKLENTPEYKKVVESIQVNGLKSPVIVRQVEGVDGYEVVDGAQRLTACKELGYTKIYIYNLGNIPEAEAKSITIWMEQRVEFSEMELAPLVVELKELDIAIPYGDDEVEDFSNMLNFDFEDDGLISLNIKCTPEQFEHIKEMLETCKKNENMDDGQALLYLVGKGVKRYE